MITLSGDDIFSLFVLLIASGIFYKALRFNWQRWKLYNQCEITRAQVVQKNYDVLAQESSLVDEKILRYVNNMGQVVTFKARWIGKGEKGQELHSDGVEIIYDPNDPGNVKVNNFWGTWFSPLIALVITFIIFMIVLGNTIDSGAINQLQNTYRNILA